MLRWRQFSIRVLFLAVALVGILLGVLRALDPGWRTIFPMILLMLLASLAMQRIARGRVKPMGWLMVATSIVMCTPLIVGGTHPTFYYMTDVAFVFFLWSGITALSTCRLSLRVWLDRFQKSTVRRTQAARVRECVYFALPSIVTAMIMTQLPLRLAFLTALPSLTTIAQQASASRSPGLEKDTTCGIYKISAKFWRKSDIPGLLSFPLADGSESGFVYSPRGIDKLVYNAGNAGHLVGHWYWVAED
jgi:hypothetical protein